MSQSKQSKEERAARKKVKSLQNKLEHVNHQLAPIASRRDRLQRELNQAEADLERVVSA